MPKPKAGAKKVTTHRGAARAKKISITVDEHVLREAEKEAIHAGRTLSAFVTEALARDQRQRRLQRFIEEYEDEHGPITEEEMAAARKQWQA